jgi:anti-anti-sigma regulatory factor
MTRNRQDGRKASIELSSDGGRSVVRLIGEFDLATKDMLLGRLHSLHSDGNGAVLDLSATTFLDSTIIGALIAAHRDGLEFTIRGASGLTRRTLELVAIPEVFPFED